MSYSPDLAERAEKELAGLFKKLRPELLEYHGNITHVDKENDQGPVTELDKKVETQIREVLARLDPTIGIAGEEFGTSGNEDTYWAVDPIDGTRNFIRGLPFCFNQAALIDHGEVVFAIAYEFAQDKMYTATKSKGAYLNGKRIHVSDRPMADAIATTHLRFRKDPDLLVRLAQNLVKISNPGNPFDVASGSIEAYFDTDDGKGDIWDYAPRALIIAEAGGIVTNVGSEKYDPKVRNIIAACPTVYDELHKLILG